MSGWIEAVADYWIAGNLYYHLREAIVVVHREGLH